MPEICSMLVANRPTLEGTAYPAIYHKSHDILNAIKCQYTAVCCLPQSLVICVASLDKRPEPIDIFGISDCNLEIWMLFISLESKDVLSHHQLHGVNGSGVLSQMSLQEALESMTILSDEVYWRRDVKVM